MLDYTHFIDLNHTAVNLDEVAEAKAECDAAEGDWFFDQQKLLFYVLQCSQDAVNGGCRDKPSAPVDFYHTCYALSGASIASNNMYYAAAETPLVAMAAERGMLPSGGSDASLDLSATLVSTPAVRLKPVSPVFNICRDRLRWMLSRWHPRAVSFIRMH